MSDANAKAELAGNYVTSGGSSDPTVIAEKLAGLQAEAREATATAATHAETREHVETADTPETVTIEVRGETIACEPLGLGQRLRPAKKTQRAEERGDDVAAAEAVLDMLETFDAVSPDEYDQAFWDRLNEDEIRETFHRLGERSAGGNAR